MQTAQGTGNGVAGTPVPNDSAPAPSPRLGVGDNGALPADDLDLDTGDGDSGQAWGENWREAISRGDATRLKRLERYATPDAIADALLATQDRLRRGANVPILPDDATDDEVKEFRKAHGIPEAAKDYGLAWPEGRPVSEADKLGLTAFQEFMHSRHVPPTAVKAAFEYYTAAQQQAQEERAAAVHEANLEAVAQLRAEYKGREFKRNMTIAEEFLAHHFDGNEEALDMVLQAHLPNGVQVKNFAPFIKGLVQMARSYAEDEALIGGDGSGGGKNIQQEYNELIAKPRLTNDEHKRALELSEAIQARAEKQGRRTQAA